MVCWLVVAMTGQSAAKEVLWQTNAEGDDIHIFDVESGTLIRRLTVGDNPHGIAWAPGSDTVFVSLEKNGEDAGELLWINKKSLVTEYRLTVGPEPHAIAVTPNERWVYVPCRDGTYWVIDSVEKAVIARIDTGGRPHNTTVSPDGQHVYLSPMGAPKKVTVVVPESSHEAVGVIPFSASVRPPAIALSHGLFFQHVDGLNGFEVADLTSMKVIARVQHRRGLGVPVVPRLLGFLSFSGLNRCHGLAVRPGDGEIWSVCGSNATIHNISEAAFPETAHLNLPGRGYWITFTSDGRYAFIALSDRSEVAVIDTKGRKLLALLKAGARPKRNIVVEHK